MPRTGSLSTWPKEAADKRRQYSSTYRKRYNALHREEIKVKHLEWYRRNPGKASGYSKKYQLKNLVSVRAYSRRYRAAHRKELNEKKKAWRLQHPDRHKAFCRKWRQENKAVKLAGCHKRRALEIGRTVSDDAARAIKIIRDKRNVKCFYCGKKCRPTIDHVNPLIADGKHVAFNLVPACKTCNCRKQAKPANEFITEGQLILVY